MIAQLDREYMRTAKARTVSRLLSYALFEGRPATTRGQWVNPLVFAHLGLAASGRTPTRPVHRPIFILGIGRSGTTLLGRVLGVHPQVGFLNEPKAVWHTICPHEDVSGFYGSGPAHLRLNPADATVEAATAAHRLLGYYCWLTRSERVVDKYPELTYRRAFLRTLFPDAVLVGMVRRPGPVVRSITEWSRSHRSGDSDWWGVGSKKWHLMWQEMVASVPRRRQLFGSIDPNMASPAERALTEWVVGMDELTADAGPSTALDSVIRYEDLVTRPEATMETLLNQTGLAPDRGVIDFATRTIRPSENGAKSRGRPGGGPPSFLSAAERDLWESLAPEIARLEAALGYRP